MPMDQQCSWNIQYILASVWPQQSMTTHLPHLRIAEDHIFLQNQASRRELLQCRKETNNGDDGDCGSYKAFIYLRYLRTDFLPRNRRLSSRHLRHSKTNFCLFGCQRNNTINVHRKHRKNFLRRQRLLCSWKSCHFQHQRTRLRIQSWATLFNIYLLLSERWKISRKKAKRWNVNWKICCLLNLKLWFPVSIVNCWFDTMAFKFNTFNFSIHYFAWQSFNI